MRWLLLLLLIAPGCSETRRGGDVESQPAPGVDGGGTLRVVFFLPGDDIGSPEHAAMLDEVKSAIAGSGRGEVVGSGFGQGRMELTVKPSGDDPRKALQELIRGMYPSARFSVEAGER